MGRAFGWLKDPAKQPGEPPDHDARTILASTPIPRAASNRRLIVDVLDQGQLESCVANAIMQAIRATHVRDGVTAPRLGSRLYGYWCSRAFHGSTRVDSGTYLRTFFQALNKFGFCPEERWPYDAGRFADMPPNAAFRSAFDQHSPTSYKRITSGGVDRIADLKRAIAAGYLVTFGTLVTEAFVQGDLGTEPLAPPPQQDHIAGGHALCAVGYDGDVFEVVNSWGTGWGDNGLCYMAREYFMWGYTDDVWVVAEAPRYSE